VPKNVLDISF